jgi:hypothetical protein
VQGNDRACKFRKCITAHTPQEILPYIAWACPGSWYIGVIAVQTTGKRNKPLWVWKKMAAGPPSPVRFEDAVAVWGYRVSHATAQAEAARILTWFAGVEPSVHHEAHEEVAARCS